MELDSLDQAFLAHEGPAQETLKDILGWTHSEESAKQRTKILRKYLKAKEEKVTDDREIGEMEKTVIKADGSITTQRLLLLSEEDSLDGARVMELMGFDPLQWELIKCESRRVSWDVTMKISEGNSSEGYHQYPLKRTNHGFRCIVTVKPIQKAITTEYVRELFDEMEAPKLEEYKYSDEEGMMLEIPIMDLHLGKLAWKDETGHNYKLQIAKKLYRGVITDIITQVTTHNIPIEKIVFPLGQDFFHLDTPKGTTTAGTQMDTDTRWQKMYANGVELAIWAIESLRMIAPVEIFYVAANHDEMMSYTLAHYVKAWFRNSKNVTVNISEQPQQYYKYGKCLVGFCHGEDEVKGKRIDTLMQADVPKMWGSTIFREWHMGHLHSEHAREVSGVIIRHISSITSSDSWHRKHGYRALRKAQAFIWDKEKGKRWTIDSNIKV